MFFLLISYSEKGSSEHLHGCFLVDDFSFVDEFKKNPDVERVYCVDVIPFNDERKVK